MTVNKKLFSLHKSGLSYFVIKLLGVLFWRQICLVLFLVHPKFPGFYPESRLVSRTCGRSRIGFVIPLECVPGTKDCNNSDNCSGNVCDAFRRLYLWPPQHCIERFGSPVLRMFFKRISQRVFRVFRLDFAAGFSAKKPFLSPSPSLSEPLVSLCESLSEDRQLSCCSFSSTPTTTWWCFHLRTPDEYWFGVFCSHCVSLLFLVCACIHK